MELKFLVYVCEVVKSLRSMKRVFCIGEVLIDFIAENQGKDLSLAHTFTKKAGGAPANVGCAIAKLGGQASFVGSVGKDPMGMFLLDVLEKEGVNISCVQSIPHFTTMAFVSISEEGERDFIFARGADHFLKYDKGLQKSFENNIVHFGAATALLGGELEKAYDHYFFDALTKNCFISFDPNFREDLWKDNKETFITKCKAFIEKSDLCKFSEEEALLISGQDSLEEACTKLHELGAKILTITLGKKGTYLSTITKSKLIPSIKVQPIDTTGAGDAFIGCLLKQLSEKSDLKNQELSFDHWANMIQIANKAGAITTTQFGAIAALPNQLDLNQI
tara:strand:+ start:6276 stop:7277 length:1002 start_codon:yes stop_codon:yes gene_type:complete